jgi:hypothetical protein
MNFSPIACQAGKGTRALAISLNATRMQSTSAEGVSGDLLKTASALGPAPLIGVERRRCVGPSPSQCHFLLGAFDNHWVPKPMVLISRILGICLSDLSRLRAVARRKHLGRRPQKTVLRGMRPEKVRTTAFRVRVAEDQWRNRGVLWRHICALAKSAENWAPVPFPAWQTTGEQFIPQKVQLFPPLSCGMFVLPPARHAEGDPRRHADTLRARPAIAFSS